MAQSFFQFKQFKVEQQNAAMKVCTDACIFGAYISKHCPLQYPAKVLDIGTGTGLLSLMYAQNNFIDIDAIDIDAASASQASINFSNSPWPSLFNGVCADIKNWHPNYKYNLILSNPPFYESDLKTADTRRNTALHSTALSLKELLIYISKSLTSNGVAAILLPPGRKQEFDKLTAALHLYAQQILSLYKKDNTPQFRFVAIITTQPRNTVYESLIISEKEGSYTTDFIALLQAYYLKL